jgi:hypothetical protein
MPAIAGQIPAVSASAPAATAGAAPTASDRAYGPSASYDGMYLGADHKPYPGSTPVSQVPAFTPHGRAPAGEAIYDNGILVGPEREAGTARSGASTSEAQVVADTFGYAVHPVHNATHGFFLDSVETLNDKIAGAEPAVQTLVQSMTSQLRSGQRMTYIGHSQGASQIDRALELAIQQLRHAQPALDDAHLQAMLHRSIHVITIAGSAARWPDGPEYDHYINTDDAVPKLLGVDGWFAHGGAGARYHRFTASSTEQSEGGLAAGAPNGLGLITDAINRHTHGVHVYSEAIRDQPIQQSGGAHPAKMTHDIK